MKSICLFTFIVLFLGACRSNLPLQSSHSVSDTTTVTIFVTERDTVFVTESDTVRLTFDCDSLVIALSQGSVADMRGNKNSQLKFSMPDQNRILVESICNPLEIEARLRDSLITVMRSRNVVQTVVVPEKYIPRHIFALAIFGGLCAAFFIGIAFVRFRKIL